MTASVIEEVRMLVQEIKRLGKQGSNGQWSVKFGVIVRDDRCGDIFEALVGTLKAAKKRKVIDFKAELLLQGVHDDVDIVLLTETVPDQ
ncbi:hypothetical protein BASA61_007491 [Batrachochytrium salamandrivorans]|nr:hypothetical protein BASA60_009773 [Batrachochytrium salamandrivorans]KAH6584404.1 hypothetical protein BASA61_007491 [Batrachochytrium salamandrivorans]KAJ1339850.1 hypothetical protein BSLG_005511 [Batrachochytrium salamandrivorans]KAJ1339946.1 hypothetical protein BSLG_005481 [Batrachochytrium salamandrivorans]